MTNNNGLTDLNGVDTVLENVGKSMGSLYAALESTMERNEHLASLFSKTIEQNYQSNVSTEFILTPAGQGKVNMQLTINNKTAFPVMAMTSAISFEGGQEMDILYEKDELFKTPYHMMPHSTCQQVLLLSARSCQSRNVPERYRGLLTLSVQHPFIENKTIDIKREFGIYIIDQLNKKVAMPSDKQLPTLSEKFYYSVKLIRDVMEIDPFQGIHIGLCIELSCSFYENCEIYCQITDLKREEELLQIQFSGYNVALMEEIIAELNKLQEN